MNPLQLISMLRGGNPQQIMMNLLGGNNNPIFNNLIKMAKEGNNKGVEDFAKNYCKENGIDFDKDFSAFMQMVNGNKK